MTKKNLLRRNVWHKIIYLNIYLFIELEIFFSNLHSDRVDNTFTCVRERGSFQDAGTQFSLGSNDENFSIMYIDNKREPLKLLCTDTVRPARNEFSQCALTATSGKRYSSIFGGSGGIPAELVDFCEFLWT